MLYAISLYLILAAFLGLFLWLRRVRRLNHLYMLQREAQFIAEFGDDPHIDTDRVCEFLIRRK